MEHPPSPTPSPGHAEREHRGLFNRLRRTVAHQHDHDSAHGARRDTSIEGIRATKASLVGLGATAALQAVIIIFSGSVALLSDTVHNLADALTAIPLWIAFSLARRRPTRSYTYGFHRAEDVAGMRRKTQAGSRTGGVGSTLDDGLWCGLFSGSC